MDKIHAALQKAVGSGTGSPDALRQVTQKARRRASRARVAALVLPLTITVGLVAGLTRVTLTRNQAADLPVPTPPPSPVDYMHSASVAIGPEGQQTAMTFAFGQVWVAGYDMDGDGSVAQIDPDPLAVTAFVNTSNVEAMDSDGENLWVAGSQEDGGRLVAVLQRIDPTESRIVQTIPLLEHPHGMALAVVGDTVWVAVATQPDGRGVKLLRVDRGSGAVDASAILPDGLPRAILASGESIWVAQMLLTGGSYEGDALAQVNPATLEVEGTTESFLASSADVGRIWGAQFGPGGRERLVSFDAATGQLTEHSDAPDPHGPLVLATGDGLVWFPIASGQLVAYEPNSKTVFLTTPSETRGYSTFALGGGNIYLLGLHGELTQLAPDEA